MNRASSAKPPSLTMCLVNAELAEPLGALAVTGCAWKERLFQSTVGSAQRL